MHHRRFTDYGQAFGAEHLIEEVREGALDLRDFLAPVAFVVRTRRSSEWRCGAAGNRVDQRQGQVVGVDLHRRVRPIADLTGPRGAGGQRGGKTRAVQANVFRVFEVVLTAPEHHALRQPRTAARREAVGNADHAWQCRQCRQPRRGGADRRRTAVVVHEVEAVLGVFAEPAQRRAPLPGIARIAITATGDHHALAGDLNALAERGGQRHQWRHRWAADGVAVVATVRRDVDAKEGAAVVENGLVPLQLVEAFDRKFVGQALRTEQHVHRNQAFLDLGTGTAECRDVDRVDAVDRVADEGTFTPAHHLLAGPHGAGQIGDGVVVIDEGIEDLRAGRLGAFLAAAVADLFELAVFVLEFEVVPVFAPHEHAGIAVLQFEVVDTLEDFREGFALLEIQPPVITGGRLSAAAIDRADQRTVGIAQAPACADRK